MSSFGWETALYEAPDSYLEASGRKAYGLSGPRFNIVSTIRGTDDRPVLVYNGHTVSTYHDIEMKGVEFLRNVYASSGLSIRPKTQLSKIDTLKDIIRAWGMNPKKILTRKALTTPHRVYEQPYETEGEQVMELRNTLKQMVRKELLDARNIE